MSTFAEENIVAIGLAPDADRWTGNPATDVFSMANCEEITFAVIEGAGGTGTATITVEACDNVTPSNTTAIAFDYKLNSAATTASTFGDWTAVASTGVLIAAGANKITLVRVRASQLPSGKPYVRVKMTETDSTAVDGAIIAIASGLRTSGKTQPNILA